MANRVRVHRIGSCGLSWGSFSQPQLQGIDQGGTEELSREGMRWAWALPKGGAL